MERVFKKVQRSRGLDARAGEGDRHVYDMMPKHLYTGKRGIGHNDRR
jgi:nucleolar GTP-binding protein